MNARVAGKEMEIRLWVTKIGQDVILGLPWLKNWNPKINWTTGRMELPGRPTGANRFRNSLQKAVEINFFRAGQKQLESQQEKEKILAELEEEIHIRVKESISQRLEHQLGDQKKGLTIEQLVPAPYLKYRKVFEKEASQRFPGRRPWDHAIDLKPDFKPRDCKIYPMTLDEQQLLDEFIKDNLAKGYIRPSKSPMASPFFFIAKKEAEAKRGVQDYRYLNSGTIRNTYPLPLVSDLLRRLQGSKIFTKLDIRWGYHNVRLREGDEWKAAFKTNRGLFEPTVMFFGLCNSPSTFQNMMNDIFRDEIDTGWIEIYMDDILIHSRTLEEQQERTSRILAKLAEHDLYLKPEKCEFDQREVNYLGLIIQPGQIAMDPIKLKGIADWPRPTTLKQVRSFLGFGNFYRRFIEGFSQIARPLIELTKKDVPFEWTSRQEGAFLMLKDRFQQEPVLLMPNPLAPFQLETDASNWATGAVLRQQDENGDWHPCGYISQSLGPAERNYPIYDKELLALIRGLTAWRHYLQGSPHPIQVLSDHKNLTYFRTAQKLNRRQARWSLFLTEFDLELQHTPGTRMIQSDALSRRSDHVPEKGNEDNEDQILLPHTLFVKVIDLDLQAQIKAATERDDVVTRALKALKEKTPLPLRTAATDWEVLEEGKVILFKGRIYVPKDKSLRMEIIRQYHESVATGHPGIYGTMELIRRDYWWPGMFVMSKNFVQNCAICQQNKINTHPTVPSIMPIKSIGDGRPFSMITVDFITDLPESRGYDSIMMVVDHGCTKGVIITPCTKTIDALGTAQLFADHVYKRFGLPQVIISDRGTQFASKLFQDVCQILGIKHKMSTAYHPQTDGETERENQNLEAYLRIFCANEPTAWSRYLATAEFARNIRTHSVTKKSPFFVMMGYEPRPFPDTWKMSKTLALQDRLLVMKNARQEAQSAHDLARQKMTDRVTRGYLPFKLGEKVWLEGKNLKIGYQSRKLAPKREGPFEITKVNGPLTYSLKLPKTWKIHNNFHASLLTRYKTGIEGKQATPPPPDIIDEEEQWEVEAIISHRQTRSGVRYLIKWKDWPNSENTWEPRTNLRKANDLLNAYNHLHHLS